MKGSVVLITGRMGSGKSHYVVSQLPTMRGTIYTNLPVSEACPREVVKVSTDDVYGWIVEGKEIKGPGYLIIDEAHFVFPPGMPGEVRKAVKEWITLTRKRGIQIWLLTQFDSQLSPIVAKLADYERCCFTRANEPDPVFGLTVDDWNQIKAKITGSYTPVTWVEEFSAIGKSRVSLGIKPHLLSAKIYEWYDSYSVDSESDTGDLGVRPEETYEILGWRPLISGILKRNWLAICSSHVAKVLLCWLMIPVMLYLFPMFIKGMMGMVAFQTTKNVAEAATVDGSQPSERSDYEGKSTAASPAASVQRLNRIGMHFLVAGQLYNASSFYGDFGAGRPRGSVPEFGVR
jgi:hypothetical protein